MIKCNIFFCFRKENIFEMQVRGKFIKSPTTTAVVLLIQGLFNYFALHRACVVLILLIFISWNFSRSTIQMSPLFLFLSLFHTGGVLCAIGCLDFIGSLFSPPFPQTRCRFWRLTYFRQFYFSPCFSLNIITVTSVGRLCSFYRLLVMITFFVFIFFTSVYIC